jgi:hypothetical protein
MIKREATRSSNNHGVTSPHPQAVEETGNSSVRRSEDDIPDIL